MKRNITKKDLESLTESQRASLRDFWLPEKYDIAVAYICTNAETEEYDEIDFVVGGLILHRNRITLIDIRRPDNENDEADDANKTDENVDNVESDIDEELETEFEFDGAFEDEDFEFAYERPTTFSKEDCLPLFSITQMIEIFERRNYRDSNFYITATSDEKACEIGNNAVSLENYGSSNESAELCDILWENLKTLL